MSGGGGGGGAVSRYSLEVEEAGRAARLQSNNQILVQGLPGDVTVDDMLQFFGSIGTIKTFPMTGDLRIVLFRDRYSREPRGEGTVTYVEPRAAQSAVQWFDGVEFSSGGSIRVSMARVREQGENRRGGGGREGNAREERGREEARELEEREQQEQEESEREDRGRHVREQEEREREFSRRLARVERDYTRRLQLEREALNDEERLERREAGQLGSPGSGFSSSLFPSTSPSLFPSTSPSFFSSTSALSNYLSSTASSLPTSTNSSTSTTTSPGLENVWRMLDIDRREGDQLRKAMERLAVGEEEEESDDDLDSEADEAEFSASVERLAAEVQDKVTEIVDRLEELNGRSRREIARSQEELIKEQEGKVKEQEAAQRQERRNLSDQFHFEVEEMRARQEPNWLGLAGLTKEEVTTSLHLLFRGFEQEKQDLEEEQEQRMGVMLRQQEMAMVHTLEQQQLQEDPSCRSSLAALTGSLTVSLAQLTSKPSLARRPQCPGCQEELVARILQCQAGHLMCGECGAREEQCAVCGGQVEGRATAMEHFLAELTGQEMPEEQGE